MAFLPQFVALEAEHGRSVHSPGHALVAGARDLGFSDEPGTAGAPKCRKAAPTRADALFMRLGVALLVRR